MRRSRSEKLRRLEDDIRARRRSEFEPLGREVNASAHALQPQSAWSYFAWGCAAVLAYIIAILLEGEWLCDLIGWVCDIIHPIAGWFERRRPDGPTIPF